MKYIAPYGAQPEPVALINEYFKGNEHIFASVLTFENIEWEAKMLNLAEMSIPENLVFDLHLDMILNQGTKAVTNYYKELISGKNAILEQAKIKLKVPNSTKINEAAEIFRLRVKDRLTTLLTEQAVAPSLTNPFGGLAASLMGGVKPATAPATPATPTTPAAPAGQIAGTPEEFDAALAGGAATQHSDGGVFGFLKNLYYGLTEDGSPLGILHLVLDILGLLPGAYGAIADIINAIIYFIRGKWLLGCISLIAALLFGAGDMIKLLKPGAKAAEPVIAAIIKGGGKGGGEILAKLPAKESGPAIKLLRFIAKNIVDVLGKATDILGKFFEVFIAKVVGWIPFIGKPLKGFFETMGKAFSKQGEKLGKFSKEFGEAEKVAINLAAKDADVAVEAMLKDSKIAMEIDPVTKTAKIIGSDGTLLAKEFPAEYLVKAFDKKAPGLFAVGEEKAIAKYYSSVASSNTKMLEGVGAYFLKQSWGATKGIGRLSLFIGKQVLKLITGDAQLSGYKEEEIMYHGNSAMQNWVAQEIHKQKEETGATYLPAANFDSSEKETFDRITNYQNNYAKLFGQPSIIPVIYKKYGDTDDQFEDFWSSVSKGTVNTPELENIATYSEKEKGVKESLSHLRYIIPYSRF
jgi:hypothetical protein